jgi:ubiquinone/menaquinone biosynthesis C-methylase UbiE
VSLVRTWYERAVFNRLLEWGCDRPGLHALRREVLAPARGEILEIGLGTGQNLGNYPAGVGAVTAIITEPELDARARRRAGEVGVDVEHVTGDARRMPFPAGRFDTVVATLVLCTIPEPALALRECARVLRPGGQLLFLEHIIAAPGAARRLQRLVEPATRRINNGCSLLCDTAPVIARSGFSITHLEEEHIRAAPPLYRRMIWGIAAPAAA